MSRRNQRKKPVANNTNTGPVTHADIVQAMGKLKTMASDIADRFRLAGALGKQFGGDRDLYTTLGYKVNLTPQDYWGMYKRGGIAARAIKAFPAATWRGQPTIVEDEDENDTPFETQIKELFEKMKVWHYLAKADKLSGIGHYGLLVLGVDDGAKMSEPLVKARQLHWLKAVSELNADISKLDGKPESPRYGLPEMYKITFGSDQGSGVLQHTRTLDVHHSRVIHIAEDCDDDDVYGTPRLEPVMNNFFDIQKIVGGSAEMFWLGARNGLAFEASEDARLEPSDVDALEEQADAYQHQIRRLLTSHNGKWQSLGVDVADPKSHYEIQLQIVSGTLGIPQRILVGNEAGELASTTDENSWLSRIDERRIDFAEPCIIRPFIARLIEVGIVKPPKTLEYSINWVTNKELGENLKADIGTKKAQAIATYANSPYAEQVVTREEFREIILGLPPEPPGGFDDDLDETEDEDDDLFDPKNTDNQDDGDDQGDDEKAA